MTISAGSIYEFEVTADVASKGKDRFKIVIESTSADAVAEPLATINNNCESEQLLVQLSQASDGFNYVLRNSDNEDVSNIVQAESGVAYISLDKSHLSNGANEFSVYVNSPSSCAGSKLFDGIVTYNLSSIAEITNVEGAITCDGNTGELELSAAGAPSDGFYRWYESEEALMAISGQNSENFVVTGVDVSKSYYVSAVNANGCEGARVEVKIENVPLSSPSVADGEFCSEGMVTLNAEGAIGNQFYKWYENATTEEAIEGENGSKFTSPFLSNSRSYFVSIANATGCESDRVEVIANVNVNRPTPPSIQNSNVCSGSSATLTASGALDGEFYRWYTSMDAVDPIADENGNILILNEVSANKDYYVSKVNGAGCESVRSLAKVVVTSLDVPEITISGLLMSVPEGFSYQWFKDGSPIEGATSSTYMASEMGGEFNVEISDGICTVVPTLPVSIDAVTAIDDILYNLGLNIYPNPVEDRLNIKKLKSQNFTLNLYDLKGDLILSNEDLVIQGSNSYFNTSVLNKGVYILVVEYDVNHLAPVKILKK
uniref:Ig-like domain-containing protein n=1 Tax=Fulvivirga sp. TaxID=1931237 RepID=UPI00404B1859